MSETKAPASKRVYFDVNVTNRKGKAESYRVMGRYVHGSLFHYGIVAPGSGDRKLQGENFFNTKEGKWDKAVHPAARTLPATLDEVN